MAGGPISTPLPPPNTPYIIGEGSPSVGFTQWLQAIAQFFAAQNFIWNGTINGVTLDNNAWTAYTPVVTPNAGAITAYTASGRYKQIGKTVFVAMSIAISNNGTGSVWVNATLPINANLSLPTPGGFIGRETTLTGAAITGTILSATILQILFYNVTYPGANGARLDLAGTYEAA